MKLSVLLLLPPLLLLLVPWVQALSCNFPAIINLGASNSDTGGFSASFGPVPAPYGITFFRQPAGRFSDGRIIIDFIAESFKLSYLSAYLDSVGTNFSHGVNFAVSGSTIVDQNVTLSQGGYSPFPLGVQLEQLLQFKSRSQSAYRRGKSRTRRHGHDTYFLVFVAVFVSLLYGCVGGVFRELMPKEEYFSQALYTFDIGQNDLTAHIAAARSRHVPAESFILDALREFSRVVTSIYDAGGRYFWIHNTGPLGCLPNVFLATKPSPSELDAVGCRVPYNRLAQRFNKMLNETVVKLRRDLPLGRFTYVDIYSAKYTLISQAEKFGFEHPLETCCGYGGGPYNFDFNVRCGTTSEANGTEILLGKSCKDPSKRIIWDGTHYTEAANKWVFDRISAGNFSDPPSSPSMACQGKSE